MTTTNNNTDSKQEAPERIRLVKRDGIFDGHWYYPDAAIMPFDTEIEYVRTSLAAAEGDGSTATIAWRIVTNYYPDDDELADAIKATLDNERRLLTVKGSNPLLSSEVAEKIAKHIKGKNSDYFSTKDGLAELESITSRHFAAAVSSLLPAEPPAATSKGERE